MESGKIVEFIDKEKIITAVVLEAKHQRLRLLTENNREVSLSSSRLSHAGKTGLDLSMGRDRLVEALKAVSVRRKELSAQVNIEELWEVLNTEQEWIDLPTMTAFCFPNNPTSDHESAVIRTFFKNRLYFKYDHDRFFPNTPEHVEQVLEQMKEAARREAIIENGANWLKQILNGGNPPPLPADQSELIDILKSYYLFENESPHSEVAKRVLAKAGIDNASVLFQVMVKLTVWNENENIDLYRFGIPTDFSNLVIEETSRLPFEPIEHQRKDLTSLPIMTIDGQYTLDFDDALSIEPDGDHFRVGVHIADVGHFIKKGSPLDQDAFSRASSIYLPDQRIPMLPPSLSEDRCSLKAGEPRPAVSVIARINRSGKILDYDIFPSLIKVHHQLSYNEVNLIAEEDNNIAILYHIAEQFRKSRLDSGAVQIVLPEINIWFNEANELSISKTDREGPGRMLIAELMIMANWLMANFLSKHCLPAIFRSQPEPKERLFTDEDGSLFQNWMQRKLLNRFILSHNPDRHSGLGLDAYVTATSPIRKYTDLVTQRQIRSVFGLESPYSSEEIDYIIQSLEEPMSNVSKIQNRRKRYWLLKYLEGRIGKKETAMVLNRRKNDYAVLLPEYMIECMIPTPGGISLKPEDMIRVTIQNANARKDILSAYMS